MDANLREVLMPLVILGTISAGIVLFVKTLTDYYLKKKMVDKGYVDKESVALLAKQEGGSNRLATLKWGLVVFFGGLGLIILEYVNFDHESPLPYGVFALSISLGFLIHFFVSDKFSNNK